MWDLNGSGACVNRQREQASEKPRSASLQTMVSLATMEMHVRSELDKTVEQVHAETRVYVAEMIAQNKGELELAITRLKGEAEDAERRAESARVSAVSTLQATQKKEEQALADRQRSEELFQEAHHQLAQASIKLGEAGAGVIPSVERRMDSKISDATKEYQVEVIDMKEKMKSLLTFIEREAQAEIERNTAQGSERGELAAALERLEVLERQARGESAVHTGRVPSQPTPIPMTPSAGSVGAEPMPTVKGSGKEPMREGDPWQGSKFGECGGPDRADDAGRNIYERKMFDKRVAKFSGIEGKGRKGI